MALQSEEEFFDWLDRQHSNNQLHKALSKFHGYMRNETGIKRGVRLQYLKRMARDLNSDGSIPEDVEYSSALRKYREFRNQAEDSDQTPTEEVNDE
jgi:hypothetical protein